MKLKSAILLFFGMAGFLGGRNLSTLKNIKLYAQKQTPSLGLSSQGVPSSQIPFISTESYLQYFNIPFNSKTENKIKLLNTHLTGSPKDKREIYNSCKNKDLKKIDENNLECLYLAIQKTATERKKIPPENKRKFNKYTGKAPSLISSVSHIELLGKAGYSTSTVRFKNKNTATLKKYAEYALKANCQAAPAQAALYRAFEGDLPQNDIWSIMEKLYEKINPCAQIQDDFYENIHLKHALHRIYFKNFDEAHISLMKALEASYPFEKYRTLYWLGYTSSSQNQKEIYWNTLIKEYPLRFHSIIAMKNLKKNPLDYIKSHKINARPFENKNFSLENLTALTFGLLQSKKHHQAIKRLELYVNDHLKPESMSQALYFSSLLSEHKIYRSSMLLLERYSDGVKWENICEDTIKYLHPLEYQYTVIRYSKNSSPSLAMAMIRQESAFNPRAQSPKDAKGLMQLLQTTANRTLHKKNVNLMDPNINILAGTKFLSNLIQQYDNNIVYALAAYNAGPGRITTWEKQYPQSHPLLFADLIPFLETRNYVAKLSNHMYWYSHILNTSEKDQFEQKYLDSLQQKLF